MYTITDQDKIETLIKCLKEREQEVFNYQINIDNYRLAIETITDEDLNEFQDHLVNLLHTEIIEQKKAKTMLSVILSQLEGHDIEKLLGEICTPT